MASGTLTYVNDGIRSVLIGTAGLSVGGAMALFSAVVRRVHSWSETTIRPTVRLAVIAVVLQATHFIEESTTGFHEQFPELLGLAPWSLQFLSAAALRP